MKTTMVAPAALFAVLSVAASAGEDIRATILPETTAPHACLPDRSLGWDGGRRYDAVILRHAQKRRLNPRLVKAVIATESQFAPSAVSPLGARGLMQVMPATAEEIGVKAGDLADPEANISAGTEYLSRLFSEARRRDGGADEVRRARLVRRVIAAYHSGPGALNEETWSEPTRRYVSAVLSCYESPSSALRTEAMTASAPGGRREGL